VVLIISEINNHNNALELSQRFESGGEIRRSIDVLLDEGLIDQAEEFVQRHGGGAFCDYANVRLLAETGRIDQTMKYVEKLWSMGGFGAYLFGAATANSDPDVTRIVADQLSDKPQSAPEDTGGESFFFKAGPELAKNLVSMISWDLTSKGQKLLYALKLYDSIGMTSEAEGCLRMLENENKDMYSFGLLDLRDIDELPYDDLSSDARIAFYFAIGNSDWVLHHWKERFEPMERYKHAQKVIENMERYASESIPHEALIKLLDHKREAREIVEQEELKTRAELEEKLASTKDLKVISEVHQGLHALNFAGQSNDREMCADAAFALADNKEALVYAASHYRDHNKLLQCAERLYGMGAIDSAKGVLKSLAYDVKTNCGVCVEDPEKSRIRNRVIDYAKEMEENYPRASMEIYERLKDGASTVRMAEGLLDSDSLDDVEEAAWKISGTSYRTRTALMDRALNRLNEFGPEGEEVAKSVTVEMCIEPALENI